MSTDNSFATTYGLVKGGIEVSAGQDRPAVDNVLLNDPGTAHGRAVDWVRRHQLIAFYLMTFSLSWSLGIVYSITDSDAFAPLVAVAACGPALAAITITGLLDRTGSLLPRRDFWRAFLLAWPIAALVLLLGWTTLEESVAPFAALALFSFVVALPVTFVLASVRSRRPAVRHFMGSLIRVRGVGRWLLVAVVFIPGLLLLAQWTDQALGEPWLGLDLPGSGWALVGLIFVKFAYQLLYFNATGEEVGWRGFALPRFQASTSPLVAAIVIGILWAPWHFWLWESEDREVWTIEFWLDMSSAHILFSVLLVWMCNRAGGSILVAGVGHAATNTAFEYLTGLSGLGIQLTWFGVALLLIVSGRMWRRLPSDHPVVYRPVSSGEQRPKDHMSTRRVMRRRAAEVVKRVTRRAWRSRVARVIGVVIVALGLFLATQRSFVADQLAGYATDSRSPPAPAEWLVDETILRQAAEASRGTHTEDGEIYHTVDYSHQLLAALEGPTFSVEANVTVIDGTPVLQHDPRVPVGMPLLDFLEYAAITEFPIVKLDLKRDDVGPIIADVQEAIDRFGLDPAQVHFNANVFRGPGVENDIFGARSDKSFTDRMYNLIVMELETSDLIDIARRFPDATIVISSTTATGPIDEGYSEEHLEQFIRAADQIRRESPGQSLVFAVRGDLAAKSPPEFHEGLAAIDNSYVAAWWSGDVPSTPEEIETLRNVGVGFFDLGQEKGL